MADTDSTQPPQQQHPHEHHAGLIKELLDSFPPVRWGFGYGSGVFKQPGLYGAATEGSNAGGSGGSTERAAAAAGDKPMLDFIFVVDDPVAWHAENLARHRSHYSALGALGPQAVAWAADRVGAGVYFNTLVPWHTQLIKYGVVSSASAAADLRHWTSLYLAGRLHKPVLPLRPPPAALAAAQEENLEAALRAALLLLPPRFDGQQLLHAICSLSYSGDVRMGLAEDSRKVHRIVEGSGQGLRRLYAAPLAELAEGWGVVQPARALPAFTVETAGGGQDGGSGSNSSGSGGDGRGSASGSSAVRLAWLSGAGGEDGEWLHDDSPDSQAALLMSLPSTVLARVAGQLRLERQAAALSALAAASAGNSSEDSTWEGMGSSRSTNAAAAEAAAGVAAAWAGRAVGPRQEVLRRALASVVKASSRRQAVLGVLSAGAVKSARYGWSKVKKTLRR